MHLFDAPYFKGWDTKALIDDFIAFQADYERSHGAAQKAAPRLGLSNRDGFDGLPNFSRRGGKWCRPECGWNLMWRILG
jgi:hypothetical protein